MQFLSSDINNEELIYDAARYGDVISLEICLVQNPEYINKLFTYDKSKWTPLLAACFYKHEYVVRMLVTRFKADIEAVGEIVFNFPNLQSKLVKDVSPLWVAVAVNDFNTVKFLIEHGGANVAHLTEQHGTTFRMACENGNLDMARYLVEHGADPYHAKQGNFTNLMLAVSGQNLSIISYLLDELKCDVNEQDEDGQTALYYAVKFDSVDVVKMLLKLGALNIRDTLRKVTPLMRAALFGKTNLVDAFYGYCSDPEWIDAKELLAANLAGCLPGIQNRTKTIEYLMEAFELRASKNLAKVITGEPLELFNNRRECETLDQFNQLIRLNSTNALNIEVTLIHQRLLGDMSKDYHHVLRYNGDIEMTASQYNNGFRWWFYMIDLKREHNIDLKKEDLREFVRVLEEIRQNDQMTVPVNSLLRILKIMSDVLLQDHSSEHSDYNLHTLLYLITIAARILYNPDRTENQKLLIDDRRDLLKSIGSITRYQHKTAKTGSSLLHLCCRSSTMSIPLDSGYPCWRTARLLINCDANIDALDMDNNTSLHALVQNGPLWEIDVLAIIDLLCNAGADLNVANRKGQTPIESISSSAINIIQYLKKKVNVIPLKCLCARLIRKQQFSVENILPKSLLNFIQIH